MSWKEYKISDLITQVRGVNYKKEDSRNSKSSGYIALLKANNIGNDFSLITRDLIYVPKKNVSEKQLLKKGDILIATSSGSINVVGKGASFDLEGEFTFGAFCKVLRPKSRIILPQLLGYFFQTALYRETISNLARGANINNLKNEHIDDLKINIPTSIETQQKIVAVLDKAQSLIRKREQSIRLLDQLLKSNFLEMFGDPVNNPKKFKIGTIRDLVENVKYGTSYKASQEGELPYLRMNNLTYNGYLDLSDLKYITLPQTEKAKYTVSNGDILFNRTNSRELVGKTVVYDLDTEMVIAGYIVKSRANKKANPYFIWGYLNSEHGKLKLLNMCKSIVGMANINAQEFQDIPIQLPPTKLQNEFGAIVQNVVKIKAKLQFALQQENDLFQSLLQDAFEQKLIFNDDLPLDVILDQYLMGDTTKLEKKQNRELLNSLSKSTSKLDEFKKRIEQQQFGSLEEYEKGKAILFEILQFSSPAIEQEYDRRTKKVNLK